MDADISYVTVVGVVVAAGGRKGKGAAMSFYRGQSRFMTESDLPIGVNDNIDQVQEERYDDCQEVLLPAQ